ncbi:MAG: class I SAM-dependent methyltransferase [Gemmatimonadales bacterium]|jgi:SAM-dependent methyltransferase
MTGADPATAARFRAAYAIHRASEGRKLDRRQLLAMPYLRSGPLAGQWTIRARTFGTFVERVLTPLATRSARPLRVLDLGAGNGWLCYRAALAGCDATALDLRDDDVDGLGAARGYLDSTPVRFERIVGSFDALPIAPATYDVVVFNASLHYAVDLSLVLREARRAARIGGRVVILDSPFYAREEHGEAMIAEKQRDGTDLFGARADDLLAIPFIEYLTHDRLVAASAGLGLAWHRRRVRYPLRYEARAAIAWLRRRRPPSRFDLWESIVP